MARINKVNGLKLGLAAVLGIVVISALVLVSIMFAQVVNLTSSDNTSTVQPVAVDGQSEDTDLGLLLDDVLLDDVDAGIEIPVDGDGGISADSNSTAEPGTTGVMPVDTGDYDSGLIGTISSEATDGPSEDVDLGLLLDDVEVGEEGLIPDYDYIAESGSISDGDND